MTHNQVLTIKQGTITVVCNKNYSICDVSGPIDRTKFLNRFRGTPLNSVKNINIIIETYERLFD